MATVRIKRIGGSFSLEKPHETLERTAHWVNKIEKEINKRLIEHPDWVSVYDEKTGNTQMVLTKDLDKDEKR